jgi:fumarylpyruvate hydrolase
MSDYLFPPQRPISLPIVTQSERFPVHRIYCVGRNYAAHAVEMGHDPDKEPPFFFQKNPDNLLINQTSFPYPPLSSDVHHEIELVVALDKGGSNIPIAESMDHVFGYAVGLDMTRRDLQGQAKKMGRPWEIGKAFEHSAPCSALIPKSEAGEMNSASIRLEINGEVRQDGNLDQLIWKIPEVISYLSELFELQPGDLIMTGTPAGVGPVQRGDRLRGSIEGIGTLEISVISNK